jgi:hypothetical protein
MPSQPTVTQIRLDNIIICLNAAVATVEVVSKRLKTPLLGLIVTTMWSLLSMGPVTPCFAGSMGTDRLSLDYQEEKGAVRKNAGEDLPVTLCNPSHLHNIQYLW